MEINATYRPCNQKTKDQYLLFLSKPNIGSDVVISYRSTIGPGAIIEDNAFIDSGAAVYPNQIIKGGKCERFDELSRPNFDFLFKEIKDNQTINKVLESTFQKYTISQKQDNPPSYFWDGHRYNFHHSNSLSFSKEEIEKILRRITELNLSLSYYIENQVTITVQKWFYLVKLCKKNSFTTLLLLKNQFTCKNLST